jgi:Fe-S-cluster containining protein
MAFPVCVVDVCKGFCCENISTGFIADSKLKLPLEAVTDDGLLFRCRHHEKETGLCEIYKKRPIQCKLFFCPSAERGFMARVKDLEVEV